MATKTTTLPDLPDLPDLTRAVARWTARAHKVAAEHMRQRSNYQKSIKTKELKLICETLIESGTIVRETVIPAAGGTPTNWYKPAPR
jgi:hypothetical protein